MKTSVYNLVRNFKKEIGKKIAQTIEEGGEMTAKEIGLASGLELCAKSVGAMMAQRENSQYCDSCIDESLKIRQKKEITRKKYVCVDNPEDIIEIKKVTNKYYIKK